MLDSLLSVARPNATYRLSLADAAARFSSSGADGSPSRIVRDRRRLDNHSGSGERMRAYSASVGAARESIRSVGAAGNAVEHTRRRRGTDAARQNKSIPLHDDAAFLARRRPLRYALAMKFATTPVLRRRDGWPFSPSVVPLCFLSRFWRHLTRSPSARCRRLGISRLRLNRLRFGPARQRSIQGRGKRGLAAHEIGPRQFVALASSLRRQVQALRR